MSSARSEQPDPVSVAVPMLTLVPGGMGGSENFARHLLEALARRDDVDLTFLVNAGATGIVDGVREVVAGYGAGSSTRSRLATVARGLLPSAALREPLAAADVVHYPFTVEVPRAPRGKPVVQSLHDVQHLDLPQFFSRAELAYRKVTYDRSARTADAVVTLSEFSRSRIAELLGVPPARIAVAYPGIDLPAEPPSPSVREDFLLYPARMWPHKNHERLIRAVEKVRVDRDLRLVLTGGDELSSPAPPWVENRGKVSASELADLYRRASCLVFPSLYEGFGMPVLEAMAVGCPVAASSTTALGEVCGDAAVTFDPTDDDAIADGILRALTGGDRLLERGWSRAGEFSWDATAAAYVAVYADLAGR